MHGPVVWLTARIDTAFPLLNEFLDHNYPWLSRTARENINFAFIMTWKGILEDKLRRFRCHTGHSYTEDALLEAIMQAAGENLWQVPRRLQVGQHMQEAREHTRAERAFTKAHELGKQATRFADLSTEHESLSSNKMGDSEIE
jgi:hypothetical protein